MLKHQGKVSYEVALTLAEGEFKKNRIVRDKLLESDFDNVLKLSRSKVPNKEK